MYTYLINKEHSQITVSTETPEELIEIAKTLGVNLHYSYTHKRFEILTEIQYNHLCNIITNELDSINGCEDLYHFVNTNVYYLEFSRRKSNNNE